MGRPKKYKEKVDIISISTDPIISESLRRDAKEYNISVSELANEIFKNYKKDDLGFAKLMMKKYNRLFQYWKSEKERLEREK